MKVLNVILSAVAAFALTSCAQYSTRTNKSSDFADKLENIYVWSAIGGVKPFTERLLFSDDTFENQFNAALTKNLSAIGVKNKLGHFSPSTDSESDLARFEGEIKPDYRLLIISPKYTTITARGITNVDVLYLNIQVSRVKDNQRVWQSEIEINANTAPGNAWREAGAQKLVELIISALRKDGLL